MKPSYIFDAHQHVFWHGKNDADLVADMDEQGIDKSMLLTWELGPLEEAVALAPYARALNPARVLPGQPHRGIALADLLTAAEHFPDRFVLGYCPHPAYPGAIDFLDAAVRMHRVRACGEWKFRMLLDDPACIEMFRYCGENKLPVILHIDVPWLTDKDAGRRAYCREWYGGTIVNLERAILACPETIFCGHGPGFWREISGDADSAPGGYPSGPVATGGRIPAMLERYPTLMCDLSANSGLTAIRRDGAFGRKFVLRYHDRLLFARDNYGGDLKEHLLSLNLPRAVTENIFHRNLERLLGLERIGTRSPGSKRPSPQPKTRNTDVTEKRRMTRMETKKH